MSMIRRFAFLLLPLCLTGCGGPPDQTYAVISVVGIPAEVRTLRASATVDKMQVRNFDPGSAMKFYLALPRGASGRFAIDISGFDDGPCLAAAGHAEDTVGNSGRLELTVALERRSPAVCNTLTISTAGKGTGRVVSDVGGIDCGARCGANYVPDTPVTLTALPDATSIFGGWGGACSGSGPCVLTVSSSPMVTARFYRFEPVPSKNHDGIDLHGVFGFVPQGGHEQVFLVGSKNLIPPGSLLLRWDGQLDESSTFPSTLNLFGVWGDAQRVWATGTAIVNRTADGKLASDPGCATTSALNAVWGSAQNDVWAVGDQGAVCHFDGSGWSTPAGVPAGANLFGVFGVSASDVHFVGDRGTIVHYDGQSYTAQPSGVTSALRAVWGSGANDIWAVGDGGAAAHYDGKAWSGTSIGSVTLRGLWGSGANDIWAVGDQGTMRRYDGKLWSPVPSGSTVRLDGIWGGGAEDIWVVGKSAGTGLTILHYPQQP